MPRRIASQDADDLVQAERDIQARIGDRPFDFGAMSAVANIYRAASAVRNHMEQRVLDQHDLSWGAFTVLFVLWIWGDMETRHLADEAGVTKGTLTGIVSTLEGRGLVRRAPHPTDRRLVLVALTRKGTRTIEGVFPAFNQHEVLVTRTLSAKAKRDLAHSLRVIQRTVAEL